MALPTLLDIVKLNNNDGVVGLIDETTKVRPEMTVLPSRTIKGTSFQTKVRVTLGRTNGSFRSINRGTSSIKSVYENRTVETYLLEPRFEVDAQLAEEYEDGAAAYIALEAGGILEGEWQGLCTQFYYGTGPGGNPDGFPGLLQSYDATNMTLDAGGTTSNTGSSAWFVRIGVGDVQWVWGLFGMFKLSPVRRETLLDPDDPTKKFDGLVQVMNARPGVQVLSLTAAGRIKNLTNDNGCGLTDTKIAQALAKFPPGKGPDVLFLTQRSLAQLQASRTATSPTGAPAPYPTSVTGVDGKVIPIKVTQSLSDTEPLTL